MCTSHSDAFIFIDQRCIDIRTVQLRDAKVFGSQYLGIVKGDCCRNNDSINAAYILRFLSAQRDFCPHLAQLFNDAGILAVRSRHLIAELDHYLCQWAHTGTADAHKMNFLDAFQLFELLMHSNHLSLLS